MKTIVVRLATRRAMLALAALMAVIPLPVMAVAKFAGPTPHTAIRQHAINGVAHGSRPLSQISRREAGRFNPSSEDSKVRLDTRYGRTPLSFEPAAEQAAPARFLARGPGYTVWLSATEAVLGLRSTPLTAGPLLPGGIAKWDAGPPSFDRPIPRPAPKTTVLRLQLVDAHPGAYLTGDARLPGIVNYFIGNDPKKWRTNVPTFAKVRVHDVYPGIDLVYYGNPRQLEHDFIVSPGADPSAIRLKFDGATDLRMADGGDLAIAVEGGEVRLKAPIIYQEDERGRKSVAGLYRIAHDRTVRLDLSQYDRGRALVIDPVLAYSTYLGGSARDESRSIAVDSAGAVYVTGVTTSDNFPTTAALQPTLGGGEDVFISKLNPGGSALVYSTYLGGSGTDQGFGVAVDGGGAAYLIGLTSSTDFPTLSALQVAYGGGSFDAFVAKLDAAGSLVYSTYLGGNGQDLGGNHGITVDNNGAAYVTGGTDSTDFPVAAALQSAIGGATDAFVAKLNSAGSALEYSTYLGGSNKDRGRGIAVDSTGAVYVTGRTDSTDFPVTAALQLTIGGAGDAFVAKLNSAGSALEYSTYLGGSGSDQGLAIAIDSSGAAYVTGVTDSADFRTAAALRPTFGGGTFDAFVTKLDAAGSALAYSTYLGGSGNDQGTGIAVDSVGAVYATGWVASTDFPTAAAPQPTFGGGTFDAYVAKLNAAGSGLVYSTYLGGAGSDIGQGIAVDSAGAAYVTGSAGPQFPVINAEQAAFGGSPVDAFVAKLATVPDLVVSALSNPPVSVMLGRSFTVTDTTTNQGEDTLVASTTRYRLSTDNTVTAADPLLTGSRAMPGLEASASSSGSVTVTVPADLPVGPYYLGACADDLYAVTESDETNNCRASTTTVLVKAPDLQVSSLSDPPGSVVQGGTFSVSDTTANQGTATAGASTIRYRLSTDNTITGFDPLLTGSRSVPKLSVGASSSGSATVTVPLSTPIGTYFLGACADDLAVVTESNESNNCGASVATVQVTAALPDLVITSLGNPPKSVLRGGSFSVSDTTKNKNQGTATAGASTTRYRLSTDTAITGTDPLLTGSRSVPSLAAGISSSGSVTVSVPLAMPVGTYFLGACADDLAAVTESNEGNNCKASVKVVQVK